MTKEEQQMSPLFRVLPKRTAKGGVYPGVTSDPRNDEHWSFQRTGRTEYEERMMIAMAIQIGVLTSMNTHQ